MNNLATIEDLLEFSTGLHQGPVITLDSNDITIMRSIARQVFKGTALTDRQFALMQEKLSKYKDQFVNLDCDFDFALTQLRTPLRDIDRSKYIKIIGDEIKVRFPFKKSDIMEINTISQKTDEYRHQKGSHEHWFGFNEQNILNIIDSFKDKNFIIDSELLDIYKKADTIRNNPKDYLSGVFDGNLKNVHPNLKPYIKETNKIQLLDNKFRYAFSYTDNINPVTLEEKIACRKSTFYHSQPSKETKLQILDALWNLNRLPIIIILDPKQAEQQLYDSIYYFRDILNTTSQSVLFREDGSDSGFNQIVHDRKLNNWVDKDTKIVYINTHKLPKLLINNEWRPRTAFVFESRLDKFVNTYINFHCDLIVFREEEISPMRKYSRFYG